MYQTLEILPGITLRCIRDHRFKQGALSLQLLRPMTRSEAATNALLPAVLLRGSNQYPDLQQITHRLDELYGASIGTLVRRIGDYQTTGFYCGFMEDRFALHGEPILADMIGFMGELLLNPILCDGGFDPEYTESEKRNLIATIESQRSDKRVYAASRLLDIMCRNDSYGIPRLGNVETAQQIDPKGLYAHYQTLLRESPIELFYVGSADMEQVAALLRPIFSGIARDFHPLPPQTPFQTAPMQEEQEVQEISQSQMNLGFTTPITNRDPRFAAMQLFNAIFGSGMTSKLFMQVREKMSLCYAIGSGYYGSKGILTVGAGTDAHKQAQARQAVMDQLEACKQGQITQQELDAAKESLLSSLRAVYDSPGAMENFFSTAAISHLNRTPETYAEEVGAVTIEAVVEAAGTVTFHSAFLLKGAGNE